VLPNVSVSVAGATGTGVNKVGLTGAFLPNVQGKTLSDDVLRLFSLFEMMASPCPPSLRHDSFPMYWIDCYSRLVTNSIIVDYPQRIRYRAIRRALEHEAHLTPCSCPDVILIPAYLQPMIRYGGKYVSSRFSLGMFGRDG
jgi:hypothetical protein